VIALDEFSRIVAGVYDAALDPDRWIEALAEIRHVLDATSSGLIVADGTTRAVMSASLAPEAKAVYSEHYCEVDHVLADVESGPVGLIRSGSELVGESVRTEFHAGFLRPYEMEAGLFVRLTAGSVPTSFLVAAPRRSDSFDTAERIQLVSALVPHLQQALCTQRHLRDIAVGADDLAMALDVVRHGIVLIAADSRVAYLNAAAERILNRCDGLRLRAGNIEATGAGDDAQLQRGIAGALSAQPCGSRTGSALTCTRSSGKRSYVVHVLPVAPSERDATRARALVVISDPEQNPEPPALLLRRLYGLTKAEAEVAVRVLRGVGLSPIAEELALSIATIKTHLQRVFEKTDTHRQAELIRLLLDITPADSWDR
jgi:DNA-binding CsgD family transcriptional regulator/PAS domain-containing protein